MTTGRGRGRWVTAEVPGVKLSGGTRGKSNDSDLNGADRGAKACVYKKEQGIIQDPIGRWQNERGNRGRKTDGAKRERIRQRARRKREER